MLTESGNERRSNSSRPTKRRHRQKKLCHRPSLGTDSLGCAVCPSKSICGGLRLRSGLLDCLEFCCGNSSTCDRVCRNHPDFVDRVREIGTFDLKTVPRAPLLTAPILPRAVPIIYHKSSRTCDAPSSVVALPLYRMVDRTGAPAFKTREDLCAAFSISFHSTIILSGTAEDRPLENWWNLREAKRIEIIRSIKRLGVELVTTPNYSLFIDRPRWDDFHAMKRIAIVHEEFLREGVPAALHVNGRTETDFWRWVDFLSSRPEITHVAYEFTTGTGWGDRRAQHLEWLTDLALSVERPLSAIVRGGVDVLPNISRAFASTTLLDTSAFMKTIKRQRAHFRNNGALGWTPISTPRGAQLDQLFDHNWRLTSEWANRSLTSMPGDSRAAE